MTAAQPAPYLNTRADEAFRFLGIPTLMRSTSETTGGAFGLMEHWEMPIGFASPYHTHHREDESFYVLEGEIVFVVGGKWMKAEAGTFVFGPREVAHGFKVTGSAPARMLLMCSPGGFERFVLDQATPIGEPPSPPDMAKLLSLAARHGIDIHGPLPEGPEGFRADAQPRADFKSLNLRWIQAFNERDWQTERALRGAAFRARLSGMQEPLDNDAWTGFMHQFVAAFPDACISVQSCIAEGETVVARWTLTGTHHGEFQGIPPTGRAVEFSGIEFNRVVDGKLIEHQCNFDNLAMLKQIGAMPV